MVVKTGNTITKTVLQKGKYRIEGILGQGEFGITYQATHTPSGQTVIIKTINSSWYRHPDVIQLKRQFVTVARRLSQCQHSNVVRVLDLFEEKGFPFLVLNYIPGCTLADWLKANPPLPVPLATHYIRQIASALKTIHQQGLLHCNIQPQTIIRRSDSHSVTLADFGITSRIIGEAPQPYFYSRNLSGGYASLEQYLPHEPLNPATDLYSLAATFYCLLTGQPPVEAPLRVNPVTQQLVGATKPDLRQLQPHLTPPLERLILWGLEIEPQNRPQSADQWLAVLPASEQKTVLQSPNTVLQPTTPVPAAPAPTSPVASSPKTSPVSTHPSDSTLRLPLMIPLLFVVTALFFGWMGFDVTRRYSRLLTQHTPLNAEDALLNFDPYKTIFENPSVESEQPNFRQREEEEEPRFSEEDPSQTEELSETTALEPEQPTENFNNVDSLTPSTEADPNSTDPEFQTFPDSENIPSLSTTDYDSYPNTDPSLTPENAIESQPDDAYQSPSYDSYSTVEEENAIAAPSYGIEPNWNQTSEPLSLPDASEVYPNSENYAPSDSDTLPSVDTEASVSGPGYKAELTPSAPSVDPSDPTVTSETIIPDESFY